MQHLAGESPETTIDHLIAQRRADVRGLLGAKRDHPWFAQHLDALPTAYLSATSPRQVTDDLHLLYGLSAAQETSNDGRSAQAVTGVSVDSRYQPETETVQFTIATSEKTAAGIFYRLTGALSSQGLEIRAAQIHTLPDGLVLDRFWVHDPDFAGEPSAERLRQIEKMLMSAMLHPTTEPPTFRRTWQSGRHRPVRVPGIPTRVNIDNSTSKQFTIIDVFTHDRTGLLYTITRTLFELQLSVGRAKIGTFLDQVVDVFYVTDRQDRKIQDEQRLDEIQRRLLEVQR
jgi:[protein-PII] uridylyltransferase